ncbi:MAG: adenylosuccinate synthetase [Alphaproteobacteria bacterium]|jgi:adenylosuccinate synthase|nr:adenylosuccinate synthetase [Alphaproteobacteria bacterium]
MGNITVIGSQWGDEGKGKIVDWLAAEADVVVRFQGGHNAGHTLVVGETTYKLHLLPSGVVRGKLSVIGNGVVVDPWALLKEIERLTGQGLTITPENLIVSESATLILPVNASLDKALEEARGNAKIGTTGRGIGPAYEDTVGRRAIRMCDLAHPETLKAKVEKLAFYYNALYKGLNASPFNVDELVGQLQEVAPKILPHVAPAWRVLDDAKTAKKTVLFEGAQGVMLDVNHGTYPYVTSSNTIAAQAAIGAGVGADQMGYVLGITKAYSTRVGSGPFPTELFDAVGDTLTERGHEFGTTTGRRRRCGWFDAVQVKQAVKICGIKGIALMKLDVMDTLSEVSICTGYTANGKHYDYIPASEDLQAQLKPVYETMPGWQTPLRGVKKLSDLPSKALKYIHRLEELTGVEAVIISTSPERDDTIRVKEILG